MKKESNKIVEESELTQEENADCPGYSEQLPPPAPGATLPMRKIAELAGCSVSTVSRVISGKRKNFSVRPALEEKILSIIRELNYQPNPFLQSMRNQNTRIIVIFDPIVGFSDFLQRAKSGFLDVIKETQYTTVGKYVQIYHLHDYTVPFPLTGSLLFDISNESFLAFFEKKKIPYIVFNGRSLENGDSVIVDEAKNTHLLFEHLVSRGHRHFAYFGVHLDAGTRGQHYSGILREQYFHEELRRRQLPFPDKTGDDISHATAFLRHHVLQNKVTAVFCYNYLRAERILHAAWQLGIRVPQDLSIVSFDDHQTLETMPPPITACRQDGYEMGTLAAQLLLRRIETPEPLPSETRLVPGVLVERDSVAVSKRSLRNIS